jgi:hypothetical protein
MNNPDANVQPKLDNANSVVQTGSTTNNISDYYKTLTAFVADKNFLIVTLVILLVLSILGINLLTLLGEAIQYIVNWIGPYVKSFFFNVSDTTGAVINKSADVLSDTAKAGVDIAEGSVQSIGNILRNTNNINPTVGNNSLLDNVVNLGVPPLNPNAGQPINIQTIAVPTPVAVPTPLAIPTPVPVPVPTPVQISSPDSLFSSAPGPDLDEVLNKASQNNSSPLPDNTTNPIQKPITANKNGWCFVGEYEGKRGCIKVGDQDKCMSGQVYPNEQKCLIRG